MYIQVQSKTPQKQVNLSIILNDINTLDVGREVSEMGMVIFYLIKKKRLR